MAHRQSLQRRVERGSDARQRKPALRGRQKVHRRVRSRCLFGLRHLPVARRKEVLRLLEERHSVGRGNIPQIFRAGDEGRVVVGQAGAIKAGHGGLPLQVTLLLYARYIIDHVLTSNKNYAHQRRPGSRLQPQQQTRTQRVRR